MQGHAAKINGLELSDETCGEMKGYKRRSGVDTPLLFNPYPMKTVTNVMAGF